ncbi:Undecaprenyl-phosphate mannosyltransferase [bioreactor metagenome]|uniref:Undecaprenyl-phosphate mannosyltransferase n=1 Tax=bioreactor metagenome TaxID=1076179 RepID=A0A645FGR8_9ZZZZ
MKYKTVSVVIPCYNEKATIEVLIDKVLKADVLGLNKEIIIVDDGSKDGTRDILKKYKTKKGFKIIFHKKNSGKGGALKTGFTETIGDIVIIQDADLEYDPNEYCLLLKPFLEKNADVVYGSRYLSTQAHKVLYYWHTKMNGFLTTLSNMFTNLKLTDMETCYKVFKGNIIREIAPKLESQRFGFEPEITARLSKIEELVFYEVPISYYGRSFKEGKKIGWKDGVRAIVEILKFNLLK